MRHLAKQESIGTKLQMLIKENLPFWFLKCVGEMEDKGKPAHIFYINLQKKKSPK